MIKFNLKQTSPKAATIEEVKSAPAVDTKTQAATPPLDEKTAAASVAADTGDKGRPSKVAKTKTARQPKRASAKEMKKLGRNSPMNTKGKSQLESIIPSWESMRSPMGPVLVKQDSDEEYPVVIKLTEIDGLVCHHQAYHEAGHAVVGVLVGYHVDISEKNELMHLGHGRVRLLGPVADEIAMMGAYPRDECWRLLRNHILYFAAGWIAETRKFPHSVEQSPLLGEADWAFTMRPSYSDDREEDEKALCRWKKMAERLVNHHWTAITAVAEALIEKRNLNAQEIRDLILGSMDPEDIQWQAFPILEKVEIEPVYAGKPCGSRQHLAR